MKVIALLLLLAGAQPPESAREVFALYGIGPAEFDQFRDDAPLADSEVEIMGKILLRFSRLDPENIRRWRKTNGDWQDLAARAASQSSAPRPIASRRPARSWPAARRGAAGAISGSRRAA